MTYDPIMLAEAYISAAAGGWACSVPPKPTRTI
jgi:hypothetical protein